MNKTALLLPLIALSFASCGGEPDNYDVKWVTPTGAPTLSFYDQAENANWLSTATPASVIPQAFVSNTYDAIVFDGISGLNLIRNSGGKSSFALARWINELPFYLVSVDHDAEETIPVDAKIDAFVQNGTASLALRKMAKDDWKIGELSNVTYEDGVSDVQANLVRDASSYDYFVLAEPVYTLTKAALANKGLTLNLIKNLQSDWTSYHDGAKIPSAGLFVNLESVKAHPKAMGNFVSSFDSRVADLVENPAKVKQTLLDYEAKVPGGVAKQFGVGLPIVNQFDTLQATNKLGFLKGKKSAEENRRYANLFASSLDNPEYPLTSFSDI